jgi:hypothetical protein
VALQRTICINRRAFLLIPKRVYQGTKPMAFAGNVGFNPLAAFLAAFA